MAGGQGRSGTQLIGSILPQALSDDKQLPALQQILHTLSNVATYFECVFVDYNVTQSSTLSTMSPIISSSYGEIGRAHV